MTIELITSIIHSYMRAALAEILVGDYGESALARATLIEPTEKQVSEYQRHHGLLGHFWIDLQSSPSIVVVDTVNLEDFKYAWIGTRQRRSLRLVLSAGNQPVTPNPEMTLRVHVYTRLQPRLEGVELRVSYNFGHRKDIPWVGDLRPICRPLPVEAT